MIPRAVVWHSLAPVALLKSFIVSLVMLITSGTKPSEYCIPFSLSISPFHSACESSYSS